MFWACLSQLSTAISGKTALCPGISTTVVVCELEDAGIPSLLCATLSF